MLRGFEPLTVPFAPVPQSEHSAHGLIYHFVHFPNHHIRTYPFRFYLACPFSLNYTHPSPNQTPSYLPPPLSLMIILELRIIFTSLIIILGKVRCFCMFVFFSDRFILSILICSIDLNLGIVTGFLPVVCFSIMSCDLSKSGFS